RHGCAGWQRIGFVVSAAMAETAAVAQCSRGYPALRRAVGRELPGIGRRGFLDSETDTTDNLSKAIRAVLSMEHYWSDSMRRVLISPSPDEQRLRLLTTTEQLVLGAIGDGSDDDTAAALLGMTISTVQSHRRGIYSTLRLHDQWDLVCAAERYGFTRFIRGGCARIGFSLLLHAHQMSTQRPKPLSAPLQAIYPELALRWEIRRQLRKIPQKLTLNLG
ncbi:MAG: hypothetical protein ACREH8_11310, partial [Opitutaceae bacterium]